MPQQRKDFWREKIEANVVRDRKVTENLEALGWRVIRIWEHEVKKNLPETLGKILAYLDK